MRFIFSGGGTGGHIYPAITLLQAIKKSYPDSEFLYVGTKKGLESDIVPKEKIPFETIEVEGFRRKLSLHNVIVCQKALKGVWQAFDIVKKFKPDVVVGTGGYVSGPILLAASLNKIPTLIQDQNAIAGITNKILSNFVSKIACGYQAACLKFPAKKTVFTGNPIRDTILEVNRKESIEALNLDSNKKTILIIGGSRGARSINNASILVHKYFFNHPKIQIMHATGSNEYDSVIERLNKEGINLNKANNLFIKPYFYKMPLVLAACDIAISRAGAIGIAELTAKAIPSILIPYPYAAENHQEYNARELVNNGAADMILNKDLTGEKLIEHIENILNDEDKYKKMAKASKMMGQPMATNKIVELIISLGNKVRK